MKGVILMSKWLYTEKEIQKALAVALYDVEKYNENHPDIITGAYIAIVHI